jgi:hypothetical protein
MPWNSGLKQGDILWTARDDVAARAWRDEPDVLILTNMYH